MSKLYTCRNMTRCMSGVVFGGGGGGSGNSQSRRKNGGSTFSGPALEQERRRTGNSNAMMLARMEEEKRIRNEKTSNCTWTSVETPGGTGQISITTCKHSDGSKTVTTRTGVGASKGIISGGVGRCRERRVK